MKHVRLEPILNGKNIIEILERFRFSEEDEALLISIYAAVRPLIRAEAWYEETETERNCIVTLGRYVDELEDLYQSAGAISEAYGLECIAMELLNQCYERLADEFQRSCGCRIASFAFYGDDGVFSPMREVLDSSGQNTVQCSRAGMLKPKKSVVFRAGLAEAAKCGSSNICESCKNRFCPNRKENQCAD